LDDDAPRVRSRKVTTRDPFIVVRDPMASRCKRQAVLIPSLIEVTCVANNKTMFCWRKHLRYNPVFVQAVDAWLTTATVNKIRTLVPTTRNLIVRLLDSSSDSDGGFRRDASARAFRKRQRGVVHASARNRQRRFGFVHQRAFPSRDIPS
jgi:hypothetical protein